MSTVISKNVQVGTSGTATNNFTWYQPASPDGTVRLGVGNSGATTADVVTANSSGNVGVGTGSLSNGVRTVIQGSQTGGAPQTSGTTQTYGLLRLQGTSFTSALDFGTNGGNYAWIQSTDQTNLATNYSLLFNPNGGNVGIGSSSTAGQLDLYGSSSSGNLNGLFVRGVPRVTNDTGTFENTYIGCGASVGNIIFQRGNSRTTSSNTETARIDSSGRLGIGLTSPDCALTIGTNPGTGNLVFHITRPGVADNILVYAADAYGPNGAAATFKIGSQSATGRSINATGTINASGADYAEYMTKAGDFTVAKGDVVGINAVGKLTNVFADAVSFVVKSTSPSYVGGDVWGTADAIGHKQPGPLAEDASDEEKAAHEAETAAFETALEAARQKVDRIAFAGQVPVNVIGATPGQYIVPTDDGGAIKGVAVSNPTFEQYQIAVGKVIAVEADGRARIIVKVV